MKTLIIASAIVYLAVVVFGHFFGLPQSHINPLVFLKVKVADANLGHVVGVLLLSYVLFGKESSR